VVVGMVLLPFRTVLPQTENGLVLYLTGNAGAGKIMHDCSPMGNNGRIHGATWTQGKFGKALSFDGVDDYVEIPDSASLDITDAITIEAWVKPRGSYADLEFPTIVRKEGAYALRFGHSTGNLNGIVWIGGSVVYSNSIENAWDTTKWTHFAFVYDGQYLRLYRNGVEAASPKAYTGTIDVSANNLGIGATGEGNYLFNGIIDEVRIYNRALSEEEIRAHFKGAVIKLKAGLSAPVRIRGAMILRKPVR